MRRPAQQLPQETQVAPRQWRHHISRCIPQADGEDFGPRGNAQKRVAQRQDPARIGRGALGEGNDGPSGILFQ